MRTHIDFTCEPVSTIVCRMIVVESKIAHSTQVHNIYVRPGLVLTFPSNSQSRSYPTSWCPLLKPVRMASRRDSLVGSEAGEPLAESLGPDSLDVMDPQHRSVSSRHVHPFKLDDHLFPRRRCINCLQHTTYLD
jgi:hypothetical protein